MFLYIPQRLTIPCLIIIPFFHSGIGFIGVFFRAMVAAGMLSKFEWLFGFVKFVYQLTCSPYFLVRLIVCSPVIFWDTITSYRLRLFRSYVLLKVLYLFFMGETV